MLDLERHAEISSAGSGSGREMGEVLLTFWRLVAHYESSLCLMGRAQESFAHSTGGSAIQNFQKNCLQGLTNCER